jgi:hypothetical protein
MNLDFYLLLKLTRSRSRNFDIPAPTPAKSFGSFRLRLHNTGLGEGTPIKCPDPLILASSIIFTDTVRNLLLFQRLFYHIDITKSYIRMLSHFGHR